MEREPAASLRVALASLGDWEDDFARLFALESDAPKETRARGNPYERRRRLETKALKSTIRELERRLEQEHARGGSRDDERASEQLRETLALRAECRAIAARQADASVAAKVENGKLRKAVEMHRKDLRRMEKLVNRAAQLGDALPKELDATFDQFKGPKKDPQEHMAELDEALNMAEEVFGTPEFLKRDRETYREVRLYDCTPDATEGIGLELEMGWVLPFGVDDVTNALWEQAARLTTNSNLMQFLDLHDEPDTLVTRFISMPLSPHGMPLSHGQVATRRLPADERDGSRLIVSTVYVHNFDGPYKVGNMRGREWLRVERVAQSDSVKTPLSRIKWCRRARIRPVEYSEMQRPQRIKWIHSAVTGPMRDVVEQNLDRSVQNIENMLLSMKL